MDKVDKVVGDENGGVNLSESEKKDGMTNDNESRNVQGLLTSIPRWRARLLASSGFSKQGRLFKCSRYGVLSSSLITSLQQN